MGRKNREDLKNKGVTSTLENRKVTTGQNVFSLRLTVDDRIAIDNLEKKIQSKINKNISKSRIYRAIGYIDSEKFFELVVKSIKENT